MNIYFKVLLLVALIFPINAFGVQITDVDWESTSVGPLPEINPADNISRAARPFWGTAIGDVGGVIEDGGTHGRVAVAHVGPYTDGSSYSEPKFRFDNTIGGGKEIYLKFDLRFDADLGTSNATREVYNVKFIKITDYSSAPTTTPDGYYTYNINLQPSSAGYSWYGNGFDEYYFNRATTKLNNHIMDNEWHTFEVYIHLGSAVVSDKDDPDSDGIVRVWEDGVLILEDTTTPMRTSASNAQEINSMAFIRHAKALNAPVDGMDGNIYFDNIEVWDEMPPPVAPVAFPGAEGFGTETRGAYELYEQTGLASDLPDILHVTNLNSSGTGSFRAAAEASGPRIVVFDVGGIIDLGSSRIRVDDPYIYIAGQTAPGDGICLKNAGLAIRTHDVLVRGIRIRPGDEVGGFDADNRDSLSIEGDTDSAYNIAIDHCSFSWSVDETVSTWFDDVYDITWSWNIVSEALWDSIHSKGGHSRAMMVGDGASRISIHHNYFAHNNRRNPLIKASTYVDVVNNVIYNGREFVGCVREMSGHTMTINFVKNYFKEGWNRANPTVHPASLTDWIADYEIYDMSTISWSASSGVYVEGNIGWNRTNDTQDEWLVSNIPAASRATSRYSTPTITETSATDAVAIVLAGAGAVPRDSVDARVVADYAAGTGQIIDSQSQVGGWPVLTGTAATDTDNDGMPDAWETAKGLNINSAADAHTDRVGDGYSNLEEYVNSFYLPSLTVEVSGTGTGTVTSSPLGIDCGSDCVANFEEGIPVQLLSTGDLVEWGQDCNFDGLVNMTEDKTCTAEFILDTQYTLTITKVTDNGDGIVTSDTGSISCGTGVDCYDDFDQNSNVQLSSVGDDGVWSGDCSGTTDNPITVNMGTSNKNCTVTYDSGTPSPPASFIIGSLPPTR